MAKTIRSKNTVVVLDQKMVKSKPWLLLTGASTLIFLIFRTKCKMQKYNRKPGKHDGYVVGNNGEIVFTYKEAMSKYGISKDRFRRAIDQLIEYGFIDLADSTNGLHKITNKYSISYRWEKWGTDAFKEKTRVKRKHGPGFKKGNKLWKRRK